MTIAEASLHSRQALEPIYGEGESMAMTDLLMENLTGKRNWRQAGSLANEINPGDLGRFNNQLDRLRLFEPIQYILGEAWFSGLRLAVDSNVLIPRPETEELVEWVISDTRFPLDELEILDVGAGSGCIPLALKKRLGKARVSGIDVSPGALKIAKQNSRTLNIGIGLSELDFLDQSAWQALGRYHIVTSNPPYIPLEENTTLPKNVVAFEPLIALFVPDDDPLLFYRMIALFGLTHLQEAGCIYVELHEDLASETQRVFHEQGYQCSLRRDMQGKERMLKAWR